MTVTYKVTWDQWFRCGKYGDDTDYRTEAVEFDTICAAKKFVEQLCKGATRGVFDRPVYHDDVSITEEKN